MRAIAHARPRFGDKRTTVEFDDDTTRALDDLHHRERLGLSEAVNQLIRRGLQVRPEPAPFVQHTAALGVRIDVTSIADTLEELDGPAV